MADDTPFATAVLERLSELREDIISVGDKVQDLHGEVKSTYAREADCVTRVSHEREQTGASVKRIWETVDEHTKDLGALSARVGVLETVKAETVGEVRVKSKLTGWIIGFLTGLVLTGAGIILKLIFD